MNTPYSPLKDNIFNRTRGMKALGCLASLLGSRRDIFERFSFLSSRVHFEHPNGDVLLSALWGIFL